MLNNEIKLRDIVLMKENNENFHKSNSSKNLSFNSLKKQDSKSNSSNIENENSEEELHLNNN